MSRTLAALLGGAAGAVALVGIVIILWFCLSHSRSVSRTSETGSSDPSIQVGRNIGVELSLEGGGPPDWREARHFVLEDLSLATKNFSDVNLIGDGKFGEVYKGLLHDGIFVAIKKRPAAPSQNFIEEVRYLASIRHRNLVSLLGYCQENDQQMLIYEYIPNGNVSSHLYGISQVSGEKLEFKHRLSIAIGAAKGLAHIHALSPRLIHKDFKTDNVLVDETFIAKVADAGLRNFLGGVDVAGPSSRTTADDVFLAPEVREFGSFSEKSDLYSFGIFLIELVSGREATQPASSDSDQSIIQWVQNYEESSNISSIIDPRLRNRFTTEGMKEFIQVIVHCVDPSSERRPAMSSVVMELDQILEKEMTLTTIMGEEGAPTDVVLGSHLFKGLR